MLYGIETHAGMNGMNGINSMNGMNGIEAPWHWGFSFPESSRKPYSREKSLRISA